MAAATQAADLEREEAGLIAQVQQLDAQERALQKQLEDTGAAKQQAVGGLLTVRRLLGKDGTEVELPPAEPPKPNRAARRAKAKASPNGKG